MEEYNGHKTCDGERGTSVCWWKTRGDTSADIVDRMRWHIERSYLNDIFTGLLVDAIEEISHLRGYKEGRSSASPCTCPTELQPTGHR